MACLSPFSCFCKRHTGMITLLLFGSVSSCRPMYGVAMHADQRPRAGVVPAPYARLAIVLFGRRHGAVENAQSDADIHRDGGRGRNASECIPVPIAAS